MSAVISCFLFSITKQAKASLCLCAFPEEITFQHHIPAVFSAILPWYSQDSSRVCNLCTLLILPNLKNYLNLFIVLSEWLLGLPEYRRWGQSMLSFESIVKLAQISFAILTPIHTSSQGSVSMGSG